MATVHHSGSTLPPTLLSHIANYRPDTKSALLQLSIGLGQWLLGLVLYSQGLIPALLFVVIESLSILHLFMIYHDLGHGSFFPSHTWNRWGEWFISFFVWTPVDWSKKHKIHHSQSGDLDKGPTEWSDTIYFTVEQYNALPSWQRALYRFFRDPLFFFTCVPFLNWFVKYRIPMLESLDPAQKNSTLRTIWNSVANTVGSVGIVLLIGRIFGDDVYYMYLFSIYIPAILGVVLFHLQHSFNPAYIVREGWNLKDSAIKGSSILTIPFFLKPWTMGIEYHHIHHYSSIVPGYKLRKCHEEAPAGLWDGVTVLSYSDMFNSLFYTLYNEVDDKFVSFSEANQVGDAKATKNM